MTATCAPRLLFVVIAFLLLVASAAGAQSAGTGPPRGCDGPAGLQAEPDVRVLDTTHPRYDGQFGYAVAGVEDVDGDGRGDLLVGAYNEDAAGQGYAGRVYIFSGATGKLLYEVVSLHPAFGRGFGTSVAGVPDADGDGRGDLLVGEPGRAGTSVIGRAYLFSGATGALLREVASPDPTAGGLFGIWVSGVPDTDGDGRGDLFVGASHEAVGAGRAYLFSGATGTLRYTLASPHEEPSSFFGKSVAGVPDVDGDGFGDLLVGAFEEDDGVKLDIGRAYAFSGATGALLYTLLAPRPQAFSYFGKAVAGVPDVDGDGRDDLLVGELDPEVHLYSGATGAHLRTFLAPDEGSVLGFGQAVAGVPDADGDGRGDCIVGARFADEPDGLVRTGRAFVFSGATGALLRTLGGAPGSHFGNAVSGVPDADGDGRSDFLVGAPEEGVAGVYRAGRAYLFSGGTGGCAVAAAAEAEGAGDLIASREAAASAAPTVSPNPARGQATIRYALGEAADVRLTVYDVTGHEVARLIEGRQEAGAHAVVWDARGLASGLYLCRLEAGNAVQTRRVVVLR